MAQRSDINQDAESTSKKLRDAAEHSRDGSGAKTLTNALSEVNQERAKLAGNQGAFDQYVNLLTKDLKDKGILPELALMFTEEKLAKGKDKGREVTETDLKSYKPANELEKQFIDYLLKNYDKIKAAGAGQGDHSGIRVSDIEAALQRQSDQRHARATEANRHPQAHSGDATQHAQQQQRTDAPHHRGEAAPKANDVPAQQQAKPVDMAQMERAAEAVRAATGKDNWVMKWADKEALNTVLKDKSDAERKAIADLYEKKYHTSLDTELKGVLSGSDLDKTMNLLHKKDGNIQDQDAGRVHASLTERHNLIFGRSNSEIEKDIRDTVAKKNSTEIAEMDKDYREKYGVSLRDSLMQDPKLSDGTKAALDVYLKGTDKRTDADTMKLAEQAINERNIDRFQEAFRNASPEARSKFIAEGGDQKMQRAFGGAPEADPVTGSITYPETQELQHARDYVNAGQLSAATQVRDNTHLLGDNEKGIHQALTTMSEKERQRYEAGKTLAAGGDVKGMSADDKATAREYYKQTHDALVGAGNATEVAKWEDMISHKGGTLVGKLAEHRGTIYNDSTGTIVTDVEKMSKADWERLKDPAHGAEYRKEIETTLKSYLSDDKVARVMEVVDKKASAATYEESKTEARRSVADALDDNTHWYRNDRRGMVDAIENMTAAEQARYRNDADFRKQINKSVADKLDGPARQAAESVLDKISKGEKPSEDIVAKLKLHSSDFNTDEGQAVRDIEKAFKDDPTLRDRLTNPKTIEDQKYAAEFKASARDALGDEKYDQFVTPLLENGKVSLSTQMELNRGVFSDDKQGIYKDLANASPEERDRMLSDASYRDQVLNGLNDDARKVAMNALQQGEMKPEDKVRSNIIAWGGKDDIMATLREMTPEQVDEMKRNYAKKYGSDIEFDLVGKLGGDNKAEAKEILRRGKETAEEAMNSARDQYSESRSGFGSWAMDAMGVGTGYQADDAVNRSVKAMAESSAKFQELPPDQQKELTENITTAVDNLKKSKEAAADNLVTATIAVGSIGGAAFTGGASLSLLYYAIPAGAALKVAGKAALMGSDYDMTSSQLVKDLTTGAVDAGVTALGPGEIAAIFKVGAEASAAAAETAVVELATREGGQILLQQGEQEVLRAGMNTLMRDAITTGAKEVDQAAILALAEKVAPAQAEAVASAITSGLRHELEAGSENYIRKAAVEYALNMGAGAAGGGTSAAIQEGSNWDSNKTVEENLSHIGKAVGTSAAIGAIMAGAMTGGMKSFQALRESAAEAGTQAETKAVANLAEGTTLAAGGAELARTAETTVENATERTVAETVEKTTEEAAERTVSETVEKTTEKATEQTVDELTKQTKDQVTDGVIKTAAAADVVPPSTDVVKAPVDAVVQTPIDAAVVPAQGDVVAAPVNEGVVLKPAAAVETVESTVARTLPEGELQLADQNLAMGSHATVREGVIVTPEGETHAVVYHSAEMDTGATVERLRKEQAGAELNRIIGFENDYPASRPMTAVIDGEKQMGWVQEKAGDSFADELKAKVEQRYGRFDSFETDVPRLMKEDPELARQVQENMVERMIYGDPDMHANNLVVSHEGGRVAVRNVDLGEAFSTEAVPQFETYRQNLLTIGLHQSMSEQPLSAELQAKLSTFVETYETAAGRAELASTLNLTSEEVDGVISRAKWFVENGKMPEADPKFLQPDELDWYKTVERHLHKDSPISAAPTESTFERVSAVQTTPATEASWPKDLPEGFKPVEGSTYRHDTLYGDYFTAPDGTQTWIDNEKRIWTQTGEGRWQSAEGTFEEGDLKFGYRWHWNDGKSEWVTPEGMAYVRTSDMPAGQWIAEDGSILMQKEGAEIASQLTKRPVSAIEREGFDWNIPEGSTYTKEGSVEQWVAPDGTRYTKSQYGEEIYSNGQKISRDLDGRVWKLKDGTFGTWEGAEGVYRNDFEAKGQRWMWNDGTAEWLDHEQNVWRHTPDMKPNEWHTDSGSVMFEGSGQYTYHSKARFEPIVVLPAGVTVSSAVTAAEIASNQGGDGQPKQGERIQTEAALQNEPVSQPESKVVGEQQVVTEQVTKPKTVTESAAEAPQFERVSAETVVATPEPRVIEDVGEIARTYDQLAEDGEKYTFKKPDLKPGDKKYYEVEAHQMFASEHPNGVQVSTKEAPIVLSQDVVLSDGTTLASGTALPNGTLLEGGVLRSADTTDSVIHLADGRTIANGTTLDAAAVTGGQHAGDDTFVIVRKTVDKEGNAILDTYTPSADVMSERWKPVEGKPGMFSPRSVPTEMVEIPAGQKIMIKTSWGWAEGEGPAMLAKYGEGDYNIVAAKDLLETYSAPTDAVSVARLRSLADQMNMHVDLPEASIAEVAAPAAEVNAAVVDVRTIPAELNAVVADASAPITEVVQKSADDAELLQVPQATGETVDLGGGVTSTPWEKGTVVHNAVDGTTVVIDEALMLSRTFAEGRLVSEARKVGGQTVTRNYKYELPKAHPDRAIVQAVQQDTDNQQTSDDIIAV